MEGLLQNLGGVLRLAAITCETLLRCAAATLSGFYVFFDGSGSGRHSALLDSVRVFGGCRMHMRHARPGLPAFFCQPCAVYIRPNGLANSHTVFCTPHRHWEGGR